MEFRKKYPPEVIARFWDKVSLGDPECCWEWNAGKSSAGYGSLKIFGNSEGAHRVAWEIATQQLMGNRVACHRCDNPACCNPSHIYAGDAKSNGRDAVSRGLLPPQRRDGERNGNAKLKQKDVEDIRRRISRGETNVRIAKDYPVTHQMVSKIRRGHFWR